MTRFKRWTSGMLSRVDWFVGQIENHEALSEGAIAEMQSQSARARVQLERVRKDGAELRARLLRERAAVDEWRERAARERDDEAALACLKRSKQAAARASALEARQVEHERIERALGEDVKALRARIDELREAHNLMRARESRAHALAAAHGASGLGEVERLFERWEVRVAEAEIAGSCIVEERDELEAKYADAEETAALEAELSELRGRHG